MDRYQLGLYKSLVSQGTDADDAPALCGFELGNRFVPGCLSDDEHSRIHSCEPSVRCSAVPSEKTVYIVPIVNRAKDGSKVPESGVGGGAGDLYQIHELELPDERTLEQLDKLCLEQIHDPRSLSQTRKALSDAFNSKNKALSLDSYGIKNNHEISLENLIRVLSEGNSMEDLRQRVIQHSSEQTDKPGAPLPNIIVRNLPLQESLIYLTRESISHTHATHRIPSYASWSLPSNPKTSFPVQLTHPHGTRVSLCSLYLDIFAQEPTSHTISTCGGYCPTMIVVQGSEPALMTLRNFQASLPPACQTALLNHQCRRSAQHMEIISRLSMV